LPADLPQPLNTYKRVNAQVVMPLAHEIGTHPTILDAVEGVLGPDVMLYSVEFLIKEPRTKAVVTMHQDLTYWGMGEIDGLTTAWLALSPATRESGCMDVVRASHKNPILPHEDTFDGDNLLSRGQEIRVDVAEADKVALMLNPGEISLHHGLTIHGSGPNVSDDRRIGVVLRYLTPSIKKTGGERDYAYLARGEDVHGNWAPSPIPQSAFDADALAVYEDIRNLQTAVMMKGAKKASNFYEKAE
jgi:phytanoyl-CoA hydroxylase